MIDSRPPNTSADHPHVRGEHLAPTTVAVAYGGSPPRAWGAPWLLVTCQGCHRITPTCVGSTTPSRLHPERGSDHPHVRGEHLIDGEPQALGVGSPPRAWGAHVGPTVSDVLGRITPTCVGSTTTRRSRPTVAGDHPHVRGEHATKKTGDVWQDGSPPRAWGAHQGHVARRDRGRITPTCVGSTHQTTSATSPPKDHPHVRGEHARPLYVDRADAGSPQIGRASCRERVSRRV